MVGFRSVILAFFLAGSSAAFAIQQPKAMGVRSSLLDSKVLKMSGGESTPELSVSPCKQRLILTTHFQFHVYLRENNIMYCIITVATARPVSRCRGGRYQKGTKFLWKYFQAWNCRRMSPCLWGLSRD